MDRSPRATWGTSQLQTSLDSDLKPGGSAIISTRKSARRMKKNGSDKLGRWTYQLLTRGKDLQLICVYQCCKNPTSPKGRDITKQNGHRTTTKLLSRLERIHRRL